MKMREPPLYMVFVLYLIISSNFLAQLFPCRLQHVMNSNMLVKHLAGYMTLLFFVVLASGEEYSASSALLASLYVYALFWFSTRISFPYLLAFLGLGAALYLVHLYENEKGSLREPWMRTTKNALHILMLVVAVLGFLVYWAEKKLEYKKQFSFWVFAMGKPTCRSRSPKTPGLFQVVRKTLA